MELLQKKVDCFINEKNIREIHFNYYDENGGLIGYIYIDELGNMSWQIINLMFKDYLSNIISYIYIGNSDNLVSYKTDTPNSMRWIRARVFIENHGLIINYNQDYIEDERSFSR